jgi:subtilase family serine protease
MIRKSGLFVLAAALALLVTVDVQAQYVSTHHVREAVRSGGAQPVGRLPGTQVMSLDLVLPLRDPSGLTSFLEALYDPNSAIYHQFLTVPEFTERFGPSQEDYDAVVRYAKANGLTVTGGSRDGMEVQARGTVSVIENAFHVTMRTYQHPTENRIFYSPDREPTTTLPFQLWHVSGLDNYSIPHPLYVKKSDYALVHGIDAKTLVTHATTGSGPSASFLGSDMRAAYYGTGSLTGAGQNLGLLEYLGTDLADLTTYYKNVKQTNNVPITLLSTDGTSTSCVDSRAGGRCDDTEQTLDMTQALGMAPGLASLVMYIGSTDTAIISAMTTHSPLPTTIGCSWGWTPADPSTLNPYFQKMAAQGQNFFVASGDSSTWSSRNEAWPADNAYIVSVGGTDLTTASAGGAWKSETAWTDSGGGISPDKIGIPSWQQLSGVINSSNKGSTTLRNGPDVAANANFTFYVCADQTTCTANDYGGTSFAAPMWAAYIALVNQQRVANGGKTIGFLDPTIYAQNVNAATYEADFHDITSGKSGSYSAVTGYDLVTGWGSPNSGLLGALESAMLGNSASPVVAVAGAGGSSTAGAGNSDSAGSSAPGQSGRR